MGVLSALPVIYLGNLCCCMWVVSGGLVAAFMLQQDQAAPITAADGAVVGLLAGLAGAVVHLILSIPIDIVMAPMERRMLQRVAEMAGSMPPDMRDMLDRFSSQSGEMPLGFLLIARASVFVIRLIVGSVFSTLGGLLGAVLFGKKVPPPTIDVPAAS
jgi:ABC-type cobalamin transport system permease subunit